MIRRPYRLIVVALYLAIAVPASAPAAETAQEPAAQDILVELFLAPEHRRDLEAIKGELEAASITRVR
ncbi:MAG: hypothetical protein AB1515_07855, partial [Nitrospirota bacterium]